MRGTYELRLSDGPCREGSASGSRAGRFQVTPITRGFSEQPRSPGPVSQTGALPAVREA